ncbi:tetratricopeptide repeat protein [Candidatus Methylacidiphilum infernorum]|uniref:Tetratricopeptide repeat protein n=2 Tax=Candidatus Methylacidiphilum infernorum TaxID=511746 RepID=A0ABX7PUE6_9BACT|nr:tetratricopeptide repeat protein [Candidatus Methylacidiphilum infernorum]
MKLRKLSRNKKLVMGLFFSFTLLQYLGVERLSWARSEKVNPSIEIVPTADLELDRAIALYRQGRYEEAIRVFYRILPQLSPAKKTEALFSMADCYRLIGKKAEAIRIYQLLIQNDPSSAFVPTAYFWEGKLLSEQGDFAKAAPALKIAVEKGDPQTSQAASFFLALCQLQTKEEEKGVYRLRELVDKAPDLRVEAAGVLAAYYESILDWAHALEYWSVVARETKDPLAKSKALARSGWAAWKSGQPKEAERFFTQASGGPPYTEGNRLANSGLFQFYLSQKRYKEAIQFYEKHSNGFIETEKEKLLLDLVNAYLEIKDYAKALTLLDSFIAEYPRSTLVDLAAYERVLAHYYLDRSSLETNIEQFSLQYPSSPYLYALLYLKAEDYNRTGRFSLALPLWEKLDSVHSSFVSPEAILLGKANSNYGLEKWAEAASLYKSFLTGYPHSKEVIPVKMHLASCLEKMEEKKEALKLWKEVLQALNKTDPERETCLEHLGVLAFDLKEESLAAETMLKVLNEYPHSPYRGIAAWIVGQHKYEEKQYEAAKEYFSLAREAEPEKLYLAATLMLAWIAYHQGDVEKVCSYVQSYEDNYKSGAETIPTELYYWIASQLLKKEKWEQAALYFKKVVQSANPKDKYYSSSLWLLAETERKLKNWKEANTYYLEFQKSDPNSANNSPVLLGLAETQIALGQFAEAQKNLEEVMLKEPEGENNAKARMLIGDSYLAQKNYKEAAKAYTTLSLIYQDDHITPRAMQKAALSFSKAGDNDQAAFWEKKLKEKYPAFKPDA